MRRNTIKMHTFYTADVQEAPRGTQGTQEAPGGLGSKKITKSSNKNCKTIVFYSRKWRGRPFRVHETSATPTKHRKNAVEHRWPAAGDKWRMATGKGRNLEETIGKARGTRYKVQGIRKSSKAATDGA